MDQCGAGSGKNEGSSVGVGHETVGRSRSLICLPNVLLGHEGEASVWRTVDRVSIRGC